MHDRAEYAALVKKQQQERGNGATHMLPQFYAQAAVKAEHLTGDEVWDWFLTFIQAALDATTQEIAGWRSTLDSPNLVNADDIQRIRIAIFRAEERISAWNAVIELPKDLKDKGEEAKKLLERLPSDDPPQ